MRSHHKITMMGSKAMTIGNHIYRMLVLRYQDWETPRKRCRPDKG